LSLGTYLRELREKHKVDKAPTLEEVADKVGISPSGLSKLETDTSTDPKTSTLKSLAKYYGVSAKKLLDLIGE
jgi:transcriptional regulator with XRE-family HTH domain